MIDFINVPEDMIDFINFMPERGKKWLPGWMSHKK